MSDFFNMGGYGAFIWSAMGIALLLMVVEVCSLIVKRRHIIKEIKRNQRLAARQQKVSR